jgi:two-component system, NarL family, response regulator DesR
MTNILLADNTPHTRSALALMLETRLGAQIIGQVSHMDSLLSEAAASRPNVIIMDWDLPGNMQGAALKTLSQLRPAPRVIITSARPEAAEQAAQAGAFAFINKTDPPEALLDAVERS